MAVIKSMVKKSLKSVRYLLRIPGSLLIAPFFLFSKKVYILPSGQLCNNLFQIGHLYALALDSRLTVSSPCFDKRYGRFFKKSTSSNRDKVLFALLYLTFPVSFNTIIGYDMRREQKEKKIVSGKRRFVAGYYYRNNALFKKHFVAIKGMFAFKETFKNRIKAKTISLRRVHKRLIGIHIRRKDYREYRGGAYCFDDSVYIKAVAATINDLCNIKKEEVAIIICSDEKIDVDTFSDQLGVFVIQNSGEMVEDLLMLSECDLILGPPSTFSSWASLTGETPLYFIQNEKSIPNLDDFFPMTPDNMHERFGL